MFLRNEFLYRVFHTSSATDGIESEDFFYHIDTLCKLVQLERIVLEHFRSSIHALGDDCIVLVAQSADLFRYTAGELKQSSKSISHL
jgi:hypothetical protein